MKKYRQWKITCLIKVWKQGQRTYRHCCRFTPADILGWAPRLTCFLAQIIFFFFFLHWWQSESVASYCHGLKLSKLLSETGWPPPSGDRESLPLCCACQGSSVLRWGLAAFLFLLCSVTLQDKMLLCIPGNILAKTEFYWRFFFYYLISLNGTDLLVTSVLILGDPSQLALHVLQLWQVDGGTGQLHRPW